MNINPFKLERYFAKYEFNAPWLLCTSDCETLTVDDLFKLDQNAESRFKNLPLGYTESNGNPGLREAITSLYTQTSPQHILVCAGAQEGVFIFMNALLKPGDHIVVQSPCYQSLYEVAASSGCSVTQWHMEAEKNWQLDIDRLVDSINPKTKAIVINFPHNPTGHTLSPQTFRQIIDITREHDLYLFSDEVYRFLEYRSEDRLPAACDLYHKAVSLGVMSKSFGLAGLRIGWVATKDNRLFDNMASIKDYTTICSSGPGEFLAELALKHKDHILKRNVEITTSNLDRLNVFFRDHSDLFQWLPPKAGPIAFPILKTTENNIPDADTFCAELVEKSGVLLLPGSKYNSRNPDRHIRFGFGRKNMPQALEKLEDYLRERRMKNQDQ